MKVKDVMTSPIVSVEPDGTISQAVAIMLQRHISGLPVIDKEGRLVGLSPRAIYCGEPRPAPSAGGLAGSNSSSARAGWRRNIPARTAARSPRS
jgi:CBS-domain-containing membrane protein